MACVCGVGVLVDRTVHFFSFTSTHLFGYSVPVREVHEAANIAKTATENLSTLLSKHVSRFIIPLSSTCVALFAGFAAVSVSGGRVCLIGSPASATSAAAPGLCVLLVDVKTQRCECVTKRPDDSVCVASDLLCCLRCLHWRVLCCMCCCSHRHLHILFAHIFIKFFHCSLTAHLHSPALLRLHCLQTQLLFTAAPEKERV